jgi:WD40 repeat protein
MSVSRTLYDVAENRRAALMSWCAGVSSAGAGLAALLAGGKALWQHALFIALVTLASIAFVILVGSGMPALAFRLRARSLRVRSHFTDPALARRGASSFRILLGGVAGCSLLAGGWFLLSGGPAAAPRPATHPEAILHYPNTLTINSVAFSPDGEILAAAAVDGDVSLWDSFTGKRVTTFSDPGGYGFLSVAFSPDGKILATGSYNGGTVLWSLATRKIIASLPGPARRQNFGKDIVNVTFSPDGRVLAADNFDGHVYLWNLARRTLITTLTIPGGVGDGIAFSPDGKALAASDGTGAYLWDLGTGKLTATLTDPEKTNGYNGGGVAFSPGGRALAVGDGDGSIYVWNLASHALTATLADPGSKGEGVNAVAFSPNGKILAAGDDNGKTYLWNMSWLGS